jgi:DNA-binding XRE family transcriptional regulator
MMEKDYLDELIETNMERDPRFAAEWPSVEAALSLAALRQKAGLTQQEVADRMGVARPRVAEIERDLSRVSFARVARYAAAMGARFDVVST